MTKPSLRGRVVAKFPSRIEAGTGIIIVKTNQTYTFSVDPSILDSGENGGGEGGVPEAPLDGQQYGRQSGAWTVITATGGGGTISNPLIIDKGTTAPNVAIIGTVGGLNRWRLVLADSEVESGVAGGSDFHLDSYNNDGTYRNLVMHADRDTSEVTITAGPAPHHAILTLNKLADGQAATFQGKRSGSLRWGMALGDGVTESGGDAGSNFRINHYNDSGTFLGAPFFIERSTGKVMLTGGAFTSINSPILAINKLIGSGGQAASIQGQTAGVVRWGLSLGDAVGESGVSAGSDLRVNRYNNAGTFMDVPLWIKRDSGTVILTGTHPANEPILAINKTAGGMAAAIQGQTATSIRWQMALGDGTAESGTSGGSDFRLQRYNNSGALIDVPLWIRRDNGVATFTGSPPDQSPILVINKTSGAGTQSSSIQGQTLTSTRWHLALGDGGAESGSNNGSDFRVHRHDDGGNFISAAMYIKRSDGQFAIFNAHAYKTGGGLWEDNSDARIKNITGTYDVGLSAILTLQPKRFTYKGNDVVPSQVNVPGTSPPAGTPDKRSGHYQAAVDGTEFIGLIAQDVETAMPELVRQTPALIDNAQVADLRVLDTSALIYALVNSIKELAQRVEALEGPAAMQHPTVTSSKAEGD